MAQHIEPNDANGMAAIGICEALLLALTDLKIISEKDAGDILTDVATAHREAAGTSPTPDKHRAVVEIVEQMLVGKNWRPTLKRCTAAAPLGRPDPRSKIVGSAQARLLNPGRGEPAKASG